MPLGLKHQAFTRALLSFIRFSWCHIQTAFPKRWSFSKMQHPSIHSPLLILHLSPAASSSSSGVMPRHPKRQSCNEGMSIIMSSWLQFWWRNLFPFLVNISSYLHHVVFVSRLDCRQARQVHTLCMFESALLCRMMTDIILLKTPQPSKERRYLGDIILPKIPTYTSTSMQLSHIMQIHAMDTEASPCK